MMDTSRHLSPSLLTVSSALLWHYKLSEQPVSHHPHPLHGTYVRFIRYMGAKHPPAQRLRGDGGHDTSPTALAWAGGEGVPTASAACSRGWRVATV